MRATKIKMKFACARATILMMTILTQTTQANQLEPLIEPLAFVSDAQSEKNCLNGINIL